MSVNFFYTPLFLGERTILEASKGLLNNIDTQGMQELFFCELKAPGAIRTGLFNSYEKVNPTNNFV